MLSQSMYQEQKVVEDFFRYPENIINILSQNNDFAVYRANDKFLRNDILSLFESIILSDHRISNIYFVANDGITISYKFARESGQNLTDKIWFKEAIEGKRQFVWVSHRSDFSNDDVVSCVRRVVDKYSNPIGVVGLDIELFKLSELVDNVKVGDDGYFVILDEDDRIIATPDYKRLGKEIWEGNPPEDMNFKGTRSFFLKINNKKCKCRMLQVQELPWKIVNIVPVNEIVFNIVISATLFFLLSFISFSIAFMMYSKNKTTQQINIKLKNANEQLKEYASTVEENAYFTGEKPCGKGCTRYFGTDT
ncbi:PDC sensor domain-containing protein [Acetivibrio straminisolvens]